MIRRLVYVYACQWFTGEGNQIEVYDFEAEADLHRARLVADGTKHSIVFGLGIEVAA